MKRVLLCIAFFAVVFVALAFKGYGSETEVFVSNDGLWSCEKLDENTVSLNSCILTNRAYLGEKTEVTVPCVIDSFVVRTLGDYAFCEYEPLKTVVIENGVSEIGCAAFSGCDNLLSVRIPESVTVIADDAFDENTKALINTCPGSAAYDYAIKHKIGIVTSNEKGELTVGWKSVNSDWYYFDSDGVMQFGWQKDRGNWYYLDRFGVMKSGWQKIKSEWYLFNSSGRMLVGWQRSGGKWYYLNSDGVMATGWKKLDGKWYYLNSSGAMQTGWAKINSKWYYFSASGEMKTGWQKINKKWYYLNSSGEMLVGRQIIDGKEYFFDSSGRWIKLDKTSQRIVYITKTGTKYHYDSACGNREYYASTLSDALRRGLTPCEKCVHG